MQFLKSIFGLGRKSAAAETPAQASAQSIPVPGTKEPGPRNINTGSQNYFEALTTSGERTQIPLYALALRKALQSFTRERIAALGRYLYDNDGTVSYAVDQNANYCAPIIPMASTKDANANTAYEKYFDDWCKRADYSGRFHFADLQRLICKALDTDGDMLLTMDGGHGFPQVRLYETGRVNSFGIKDPLVKHIDGVAIDTEETVIGYYVVDSEAVLGMSANRNTPPVFIPSTQSILLYDADRFSSYRGFSPIRRGMNDVRDAKDIKGFAKLATKIGSALAAAIEGSDTEEENVWSEEAEIASTTDDTDNPPTQQEKTITQAQLLGGDIPVLPEGKKLTMQRNDQPGELVMELLDFLGGAFISGLGVPSAFYLTKKMTGPSQRGVNGQAQRKFNHRQGMLACSVEWTWIRVIAWGIEHDGLPFVEGWDKPEWQGPPEVSIDSGEDATAWREDVSNGLMTRREHYAKRALNWKRETDQGFIEDDYILTQANALAKKQKVSVELILLRWGYTQPKPIAPVGPSKNNNASNADENNSTPNN
jgi:capsid protein